MTDWPGVGFTRPTITSFAMECMGPARITNAADPGEGSATWPQANVTIYMPLLLSFPKLVTKVFWVNGTAVSGNCALALYIAYPLGGAQGSQVYTTGTTAQAGTSALQITTLGTPIVLQPGLHYFGFGCDNTTAQFMRSAIPNLPMRIGGAQAEGNYPPPNPSAAQATGQSYWPLVGLSCDANL